MSIFPADNPDTYNHSSDVAEMCRGGATRTFGGDPRSSALKWNPVRPKSVILGEATAASQIGGCCPDNATYPISIADQDVIAGYTPPNCSFQILATVIVYAHGACAGCYYDGTNFSNHSYLLSSGQDAFEIPWIRTATSMMRITRGLVWLNGLRHDDSAGISPDYGSVSASISRTHVFGDNNTTTTWAGRYWCNPDGDQPNNNCQYNGTITPTGIQVGNIDINPNVDGLLEKRQVWDGGGFLSYDISVTGTYFWGVSGGPPAGFRIDSNTTWGGNFIITFYIGRMVCP